jgi:5-deoxy-glucuronate isomerase
MEVFSRMITKYQLSPKSGPQTVFELGKNKVDWLELEVVRLEAGVAWKGEFDDLEAALVPLSGRLTVSIDNGKSTQWKGVGGRADIFNSSPWAIYAPRKSRVQVVAESKLELAVAKAPCDQDLSPTVIKPDEVKVVSSGVANWRRDVRMVIAPGSAISQRLIVGETINPPGNWSGIPPHKHDEISSKENFLEEFYWYKAKPANGYGIQLGYKDGLEESFVIHDDDVFLMQNGYHPTVAAPGTTLGYLWVLSGESKAYNISTDPQFDWVVSTEAVIKEMQR